MQFNPQINEECSKRGQKKFNANNMKKYAFNVVSLITRLEPKIGDEAFAQL